MTDPADRPPLRLGVLRRAGPPPHPAVAAAEARVIRTELERRLGRVTLDLRIDGDRLADWRPVGHAAWPSDVDAVIDADRLWGPELPPLTCLFGRTVEPAAADVRRRMLRHLGVVPDQPFDLDPALFDELDVVALRPTDLWLVAGEAGSIDHPDPAVVGLAAAPNGPEQTQLDRAFDDIADELAELSVSDRPIARLTARVDELTDELAAVRSELARTERESAEQLEHLAALNATLAERLERAEMVRSIEADHAEDADDAHDTIGDDGA